MTNPTATLDDVIASLTDLVDVAKVSQTVAAASQQQLAFELADLHKTLAALPGEIALEHDIATGAREQNGAVSAYDRPQPVIIVGPKPLQVTIVGGLPGQSSPGQPPKPPTPKEDEPGFFGRLWQRTRFGKAGANAQKSVGSLLGGKGPTGTAGLTGAAAGAARLAGPIGVAVAFASALDEARKAVIQHTDQQLASARKLAEVSGSMAVVMAQRDMQEMFRGMRQGDATAASTGRLAAAEQRRKDASEQLENNWDNAKNQILAALNDSMVPILEKLSVASDMVVSWLEKLGIMKGETEEEKRKRMSPIGIAADMGRIEREAKKLEDDARGMMAAARAAAGSGRVVPPGGRLP